MAHLAETKIGKSLIRLAEKLCNRLGMNVETFWQFVKYIICGFTAYGCELTIFWILEFLVWPMLGTFETNLFGMLISSKNISHTLSMTCGYIIAFTLNRVWSFKSKSNLGKQFLKSFVLFIFNIITSNILINIFVDTIGMHKLVAKNLQMAIIVLWNFILYKKVIYK